MNSPTHDRTWPMPTRPWSFRMKWHDLLFMHWRVDFDSIRSLIPKPLEIDSFDGDAWIGIVPFHMTGVAPRYFPDIPLMSRFPELNVRTYVNIDNKPGVWFFSLEATNPIAVRAARKWFHLPYMDAKIDIENNSLDNRETSIRYRSRRTHRSEAEALFDVEYGPVGLPFFAEPESLAQFLTARYCLYTADARGDVFRGEINHPPWELQSARAIVKENTMSECLGIKLPDEPPVLHFARQTNAVVWSLERI